MTSFKFKGVTKTALLTGAIAVLIPLAGCASKDDDIDLTKYVETIDPADKTYNEGLANLDAGRLDEAAKKFAAVDRQHPYTEWARKSLVMAAFTNYRKGNYEEAISMAKRYNTLYPTSPESAYAYYIIGLSYFRQIPDVTRDQAASRRAIAAMQEVVDRFPDSEYTDDAKAKIRFARDQLAGKEMQVGRYYLERKEYLASIKRFRGVVEEYSNTIRTARGTRTATSFCRAVVLSHAKTVIRGWPRLRRSSPAAAHKLILTCCRTCRSAILF